MRDTPLEGMEWYNTAADSQSSDFATRVEASASAANEGLS